MRPMGTAAYGGKGQGKGKGRGEGRLGHGGRGRSKGGEKLMGTTADGGKGSKGRAANGDRRRHLQTRSSHQRRRAKIPLKKKVYPLRFYTPTKFIAPPPLRNGNGGPKQRLGGHSSKEREGQRMAIGQWAPPAADENTIPWLLAKTPPRCESNTLVRAPAGVVSTAFGTLAQPRPASKPTPGCAVRRVAHDDHVCR